MNNVFKFERGEWMSGTMGRISGYTHGSPAPMLAPTLEDFFWEEPPVIWGITLPMFRVSSSWYIIVLTIDVLFPMVGWLIEGFPKGHDWFWQTYQVPNLPMYLFRCWPTPSCSRTRQIFWVSAGVGRIGCKRFSAVFEKGILHWLNGFGDIEAVVRGRSRKRF